MERADISFNKGIHRSPNYSEGKGELSECVNIMPVRGELKNIPKASKVKAQYNSQEIDAKMPANYSLAAIHNMQTGKRYLAIGKSVGVFANTMYRFYGVVYASDPLYWTFIFAYALDVDITISVDYLHNDELQNITAPISAGGNTYNLRNIPAFSAIDFDNDRIAIGYTASPVHITNTNNSVYKFSSINTAYSPELIKSTTPVTLNSVWSAAEGDVNQYGILNFTAIDNSEKIPDAERMFSTIGNTLIEYGDSGTNYYLWEGESYTNLGSELPSLNVRPYIRTRLLDNTQMLATYGTNMESISNTSLVGDGLLSNNDAKHLYDYKTWIDGGQQGDAPQDSTSEKFVYGSQRANIASRLFSVLNQYTEVIKRDGLFTAPFFVRFAYRMYDGSHVMHTPPVLMTPNTIGKPVTRVLMTESNGNYDVRLDPIFMTSTLFADIDVPDDISKWYDIITHIDCYVTPEIISYSDSDDSVVSIKFNEEYIGVDGGVPQYDDNKFTTTGRYMTADDENGSVIRKLKLTHNNTDYESSYLLANIVPLSGGSAGRRNYPLNHAYKDEYLLFATTSSSFHLVSVQSGHYLTPLDNTQLPQSLLNCLPTPLWDPAHPDVYNFVAFKKGYDANELNEYTIVQPTINVSYYLYWGPVENVNNAIAFAVNLQRSDSESIEKLIREESEYNLISSIEISSVSEMSGVIDIKQGVLNSISTMETLPEVGQGRRGYLFSSGISYNNRMNLVVEKETLPSTDKLENTIANCTNDSAASSVEAYIMCKENGQTVYREIEAGILHEGDEMIYFAYPSATAIKLLIKSTLSSPTRYQYHSISLRAHPILDLAQAFDSFNDILSIGNGVEENISNPSQAQKEFEAAQAGETYVEYGNKIVVSNPDNPFVFREDQFRTLQGNILAIATTSKPLSEGQFGQFPLYAFCDDGVWALEINNDGTYQAPQIVSGEVCNNKKTVTQLDDGVSFTTDGGLLLLTGREIAKISGVLDGYNVNDFAILSGLTQAQLGDWYSMLDSDTSEFAAWCSQATYAFDSVNKLIRIYCAGKRQMVYSIESGEFSEQIDGFTISNNMRIINDYPYIIIQDGQNLYTYRKMLDDGIDKKGFALTRILSVTGADKYTAISQIKTFLNSVREIDTMVGKRTWIAGTMEEDIVYTDSATPSVGDKVYYLNGGGQMGVATSYNPQTQLMNATYMGSPVTCVRDSSHDEINFPSAKIVVLASNDMITWIPLSSLKGQSFKYYRVALFSDMYDNDSLSGMAMIYETRRTNKLR